MDKNKRTLIYIFGGLAVLIAGASVWYFFLRDQCDPNRKGYTKKGKLSDKCFPPAQDPKTILDTPPVGCTWISDDTFPLKRCMSGNKVKALQTALGISADGKFGTDTESAVNVKFKKNDVTEPEYNNLINPPAPPATGGTNFTKLKTNLGTYTNFSGGVQKAKAGKNKNYVFYFYATNGRFFMSEYGTPISNAIVKGTYTEGADKMFVDGGDTYNEGGVNANMIKIVDELGQ